MKANSSLKPSAAIADADALASSEPPTQACLPPEVIQAMARKWGIFVDAYLVEAARVGNRYAALVFCDQSGAASDGMTIATPPVRHVCSQGPFKLLQTLNGSDHYVLVTEHRSGVSTDGDGN